MTLRRFLATATAAGSLALLGAAGPVLKEMTMTSTVTQSSAQAATAPDAIRPFQVHIPDSPLADPRRRINATRWPDKETVADQSQGIGRTLRGLGAAGAVRD
jgi:hypothetical protein